ncbi:MAG: hypothetical protein IKZ16_03275, partial [Clostridia bacterium]|nr:hypothetical protein [Clostridia bacterium]
KQAKQLTARGTMENKPVLGVYMDENGEPIITTVDSAEVRPFTVEEAKEMIDALKSKYDYFGEKAEAVWAYNRNLNQYRVDTGLITQESFDEMQWLYPHYVPTYRVDSNSGIASIEGKYNLAIKKTVKGAKGSTKRLISPEVIIARQTMETIPAGRENQLTRKLAEAAERRGKNNFIEVVSTKKLTAEELAELDPTTIRPKGGQITYFKDGEMQTLNVAKEIFAGYESFTSSGNSNAVYDAVTYLNSLFKRLVTSASPAFIVRNSLRDIQEAGINTHYPKAFLKNYGVAIEQYRTSGKWLHEFMAFGGLNSSLFDFNKGAKGVLSDRGFEVKDENVLKKALHKFEDANQMVEMLPRLAEYISAREAGMSPEKAILDAADVTTNFGRSGRVTRVLNRTIVPFLNPSIQGFSKMVRNVTDAFGAGSVSDVSRALGSLALKAALVGILPMMLNRALYEDDEDYQNLRDTDKENNYLFKIGDTFIKLPRGRVASALAGLYNRSVNVAQGKKFDVLGYIENLSTQVTPVDSASRNIFSPILRDLPTNTTWYGTAIEGREFENLAPEDRYDEGTSSIAIAIGKVINYSPKKIHYLLDQYSKSPIMGLLGVMDTDGNVNIDALAEALKKNMGDSGEHVEVNAFGVHLGDITLHRADVDTLRSYILNA